MNPFLLKMELATTDDAIEVQLVRQRLLRSGPALKRTLKRESLLAGLNRDPALVGQAGERTVARSIQICDYGIPREVRLPSDVEQI